METEIENTKVNFLVNKLEKSYYYIEKTNTKLVISFIVGLITFFYSYFFTPYNTDTIENNLFQISIESTLLVVLVVLTYFFIVTKLFPSYFNKKSWTVGKHIFIATLLTVACATAIWIYTNSYVVFYDYRDAIFNSAKVSLIPVILQVLLNDRMQRLRKAYYQLKIEEQKERKQKEAYKTEKIKDKRIKIFSYNKKDFVHIKINKLVYISSEANYASFFIDEKGKLKELVLRRPLIQIEKELSAYNNIVRCHKSYIINSEYIEKYSGNAHGYRLKIKYLDIEIPVSRKFSKEDILKLVS